MLTKKYFSIAEVVKMSGLAAHRLRYIEKSDPNIKIVQIRERRYYTKDNIDYIKTTYSTEGLQEEGVQEILTPVPTITLKEEASTPIPNLAPQIISQIDQLIAKFSNLADQLAENCLQN